MADSQTQIYLAPYIKRLVFLFVFLFIVYMEKYLHCCHVSSLQASLIYRTLIVVCQSSWIADCHMVKRKTWWKEKRDMLPRGTPTTRATRVLASYPSSSSAHPPTPRNNVTSGWEPSLELPGPGYVIIALLRDNILTERIHDGRCERIPSRVSAFRGDWDRSSSIMNPTPHSRVKPTQIPSDITARRRI